MKEFETIQALFNTITILTNWYLPFKWKTVKHNKLHFKCVACWSNVYVSRFRTRPLLNFVSFVPCLIFYANPSPNFLLLLGEKKSPGLGQRRLIWYQENMRRGQTGFFDKSESMNLALPCLWCLVIGVDKMVNKYIIFLEWTNSARKSKNILSEVYNRKIPSVLF